MPTRKAADPSPSTKQMQQAPATMPDGPNVAPSLHEHEAAMGTLEQTGSDGAEGAGSADGAQPASGAGGTDRSGANGPDGTDGTDGADGADADREQRIRAAAYALAERRGFEPGRDVDDWLEAERQLGTGNTPPRA